MLVPIARSKLATLSKVALGVFCAALFAATHMPPPSGILPTARNDKIEHFVAYLLLAFLLAVTWQFASGILTSRHLWIVWIGALFFGAFDEITQILVHRECDLGDWAADGAGAATGLLLFVVLRRLVAHRIEYRE